MSHAVHVEELSKRYADTVAVDGVSFAVREASVFALLGRNGAGKTTTVECLEGFRRPDAGRVRVLDLDPVRDRDALMPRIGVMLQGGGAWPAATPREMVRLYSRFYADALDPDDLLERVGLASRADARFRALSGGEQQALNLALALVGRPQLVLLDEPTAGLDVRARRRVWEVIDGLRSGGATVLLTTHLTDEVERLADTVAVIDHGKLVALDSPAGLLAGSGAGRVRVHSPAAVDVSALSEALGVPVEPDGPGQWVVHTGADAVPRIAAWFAERGLPLSGVRAGTLDDVLLRLTEERR